MRRWVLVAVLAAACASSSPEPELARISIEPLEFTLVVGDERPLEVRAWDGEGTAYERPFEVRWTSQAPEIAAVSEEGLVEGRAPGVTTLRASVGGRSAEATVRVEEPAGSFTIELERSASDTDLHLGEKLLFKAQAFSRDGTRLKDLAVQWTVSDPAVLELAIDGEQAFATAVGRGRARIRAAIGRVHAEEEIAVVPRPTALQLHVPVRMVPGERQGLEGAVLDEEGVPIPGTEVQWRSTRPEVVRVEGEVEWTIEPEEALVQKSEREFQIMKVGESLLAPVLLRGQSF